MIEIRIDISKFSLVATERESLSGSVSGSGGRIGGCLPAIIWSVFRQEEIREVDSLSRPYARECGASYAEVRHKMTAKLIAGG